MPSRAVDARTRALVTDMLTPPTPVDDAITHLTQLMALAELLAEDDDRRAWMTDPLDRESYLDEAKALMPALLDVMSAPPAWP